jgi:hypothetical protein
MCPQTLKSSVVSDCLKKIMNEVIVQQLTTTTPVLLRSTYYKRINNTKLLHELSSPPNLSSLIIGATSKVYTYKKNFSWDPIEAHHVAGKRSGTRSCLSFMHISSLRVAGAPSNIMLTAQPAYGQVDT